MNRKSINDWILDKVRVMNDDFSSVIGWLEDVRWEWMPCVSSAVNYIVNGGTLFLYTDDSLVWFREYIMSKLNNKDNNRPFVTVYQLDPSILRLAKSEEMDSISMHLGMSFDNYAFWYVGKYNSENARLALNTDNSLLWLLDEQYPNAFCLNSNDDKLASKLLQLYEIFEITLFGRMFEEFEW